MRNESGFTLIELIVAAAIAGIMLAVTLPGFINYKSSLTRNQVRWGLLGDLRYARQQAVTNHKLVVIAFGNGSTTTDLTTYTLHTDTNGNKVKDNGEPVLSRTLPKGAYLTKVSLTPTDSVIFDSSGSLYPGSTGGSLIFRGPKGASDTLLVSAIGMVYHQ